MKAVMTFDAVATKFQLEARQRAAYESFECPACFKPMHLSNWQEHCQLEHAGQTLALPPEVVIVDEEFKSLIPPLAAEEYEQLEANILAEGCRDALVIWKGRNILVDGHNRYAICARHDLPYKTVMREFESREDVVVWMIRNQLARRNITPYARGELALRLKDAIAAKAKENMAAGGKGDKILSPLERTNKELAKTAEVSHETIRKVEKVTRDAPETVKAAARAGEISTHRAYELTRALEKLPGDDRDAAAELCGDSLDRVNILVRLFQSPDDLTIYEDILSTGGFHSGDTWCNFKQDSVEAIAQALRNIEPQDTPQAVENETEASPEYTSKSKPQRTYAADEYTPHGYDACQTPAYAIDPLLPYLQEQWIIWESAAGEGRLVEALYNSISSEVIVSDILTGQNFFDYTPEQHFDCIVTNPPYSLKYRWLERCYALGKPFALLVPVETLGAKTAQEMFREHGVEIMLLDQRVNFQMPYKGFEGTAQFPVMWLCWKLLPEQIMFGSIEAGKKAFKKEGGHE